MTGDARGMLEYLDDGRRWHKGNLYGPGDSACLVGAATIVSVHDALWPLLQKVIVEQYGDRVEGWADQIGHPAAMFNDHPDTAWPDVERVLEKTALAEDDLG